jgi:hypothetical protein
MLHLITGAEAAVDLVLLPVVVVRKVYFRYIYIYIYIYIYVFFTWRCSPTRAMVSSFTRFSRSHTRRATVGRTPLDE